LTAGFCPKNLVVFARKIMALPDSGGGLQPPSSRGSYAYGQYSIE